jgi:hypothetical protein
VSNRSLDAGRVKAHHLLDQRTVSRRLASMLSVLVVAAAVSLDAAAPSAKKTFVSGWEGRRIVLTQPLYSIVYDERSRFLPSLKKRGKVTGLTVTTPSATYYEFEALRESEDDIIERDPNRVVSTLRNQYRRAMHLDLGSVQDVEPLMLVRYDPGVELLVGDVQIERDRVRLSLHKERNADRVTTLTVKWPVPLSSDFTEAALVEGLLARFISRQ